MVGVYLQLKFEDKGAGLVAGAAWIMANGRELTADCAGLAELDARIRDIEQDLRVIRAEAKRQFTRLQGHHTDDSPRRPLTTKFDRNGKPRITKSKNT